MIGRRSRGRKHDAADGGQATVELALCMPLVCLLLLAVVQLAIVVRDQLMAIDAARQGARAAAAAADPVGAGSAHAAASGTDRGDGGSTSRTVAVTIRGDEVTVEVRITDHTDVPLIGALLPDVDLRGSATMQLEPP